MAKKVTRWRPDTCGCVLEYEWDDTEPEDARVHTPVAVEALCKAHAAYAVDAAALLAQINLENNGKNEALARIVAVMPELTDEVVDDQGDTVRVLKREHEFTWSFDKNRELAVKVRGVPADQVRNALKD